MIVPGIHPQVQEHINLIRFKQKISLPHIQSRATREIWVCQGPLTFQGLAATSKMTNVSGQQHQATLWVQRSLSSMVLWVQALAPTMAMMDWLKTMWSHSRWIAAVKDKTLLIKRKSKLQDLVTTIMKKSNLESQQEKLLSKVVQRMPRKTKILDRVTTTQTTAKLKISQEAIKWEIKREVKLRPIKFLGQGCMNHQINLAKIPQRTLYRAKDKELKEIWHLDLGNMMSKRVYPRNNQDLTKWASR